MTPSVEQIVEVGAVTVAGAMAGIALWRREALFDGRSDLTSRRVDLWPRHLRGSGGPRYCGVLRPSLGLVTVLVAGRSRLLTGFLILIGSQGLLMKVPPRLWVMNDFSNRHSPRQGGTLPRTRDPQIRRSIGGSRISQ